MIGQTISHYRIIEKLGGGGMGVVYKAEDTTLKRVVALKFLPSELTTDQQSKARFLHEAQAASKIDHPNICGVHDIGQTDDGETYIVMSYYEGETLKKKIARGRLKVEQSLELAAQIAEGLSKAHAAEIIHRDIKPANIFVTKDGIAKILDFGLAKLKGETRLTQTGATVGTLAYMAPEQVQGQETDARSDIWSLGVVLYEMLTGVTPFKGDHEGALLYEIMSADPPPMTKSVPDIDPESQQLVMKCLEKDPEERYQAVKDISVDCRRIKREMKTLRQMSATYSYTGRGDSPSVATRYPLLRPPKKQQLRAWMALAAIFFCTTVYLSIRAFIGGSTVESGAVYGEIRPPENGEFSFVGAHAGPIVLSPDGKRYAYVVSKGKDKMLWVRKTDEAEGRAIDKPECRDVSYPFWSPDGQWIAFFSGDKLKKVDVESGMVKEICNTSNGLGGSWNREGTILYAPSKSEPIFRVSEFGGTPQPVTVVDANRLETYHQFPCFLPDGNHFLYLARTTYTNVRTGFDSVCVSSLDSGGTKRLFAATSNVVYANGYLLYSDDQRMLTAVPFDLASLSLAGGHVQIARVKNNDVDGGGVFTVSQNNLLAYQKPPSNTGTRLVIYDRNGNETGSVGVRGGYMDVRFAPDGKGVAYSFSDVIEQTLDIWISGPLSTPIRFAHSPFQERFPVWSPDGKEIVFSSDRTGSNELYRKSLTSGAKEILIPTTRDFIKQPYDWSQDGKYIAFVTSASVEAKNRSDIRLISLKAKNELIPWLTSADDEWDPRFSPDGRWIAYTSTESATKQFEVFVSPVEPFNPQPLSYHGGGDRAGGRGARWANGGKEIFYLTLTNKLMVLQVKPEGPNMKIVNQKQLFQAHPVSGAGNYDVSADGTRIIINTQDEEQISPPVWLVSNWTQLLNKKIR